MRLTLDALETLDAIDQQGSFAKAAEALHRVPSAVTYTVQKLESDLGVHLFDRSGKRARLTEAGQALVERGRELLRRAESLENTVKRVSHGWETKLTLAVDEIMPIELVFPLIAEFDGLRSGTRIRLTRETFGGAWDALIDRRTDLSLDATGEMPQGYGLARRRWCSVPFEFAVARHHPLADAPEPLNFEQIVAYRAVAAADSSRKLAPRSSGILDGQDTLIVPSLSAKLSAQLTGLGIGFLPEYMIAPHRTDGTLVVREVEAPRAPAILHLAWRAGEEGRALSWFRERVAGDAQLLPRCTPSRRAIRRSARRKPPRQSRRRVRNTPANRIAKPPSSTAISRFFLMLSGSAAFLTGCGGDNDSDRSDTDVASLSCGSSSSGISKKVLTVAAGDTCTVSATTKLKRAIIGTGAYLHAPSGEEDGILFLYRNFKKPAAAPRMRHNARPCDSLCS
ncbi:MAG: LysR family transcriptional regulator [Solimonas sp.]